HEASLLPRLSSFQALAQDSPLGPVSRVWAQTARYTGLLWDQSPRLAWAQTARYTGLLWDLSPRLAWAPVGPISQAGLGSDCTLH
ncbi:hypothetical protein chiPu_0032025, partial [Chiloscyllium punctatum]|nr:hypothetical protein [Chiloscyllium punctatum]